MLTDFFIANLDEVSSINSVSEVEGFPILRAKRIDTVKLSTLDEIMTSEVVDYDEPFKEIGVQEAWLFLVRKELVDSLAKSSSFDLKNIANKWAKTDEWILDGETERNLANFLNDLKKLAIQSKSEKKDLFLIISL